MILKELILRVSSLGGYDGLERTDFNSFYFGRVWFFLLSQLANQAEWINLVNFKKPNHSSINFTCQKIIAPLHSLDEGDQNKLQNDYWSCYIIGTSINIT